jgi:putative iron-dependent peroxidase
LVNATRRIASALEPVFRLEQVVDGFRHGQGLDLTGYEDGTENPEGNASLEAALVLDGGPGLPGSSFVAVQQWLHNFALFDSMTSQAQDNMVGRRRSDNAELDDAPRSAHVKRTAQESFTPEAFVLRRSMPWASGAQAGLMFVAFGHSLDAFEAQMRRMAGLEDGVVDALFLMSKPLTGAYFWCPPMHRGRLDLRALGL